MNNLDVNIDEVFGTSSNTAQSSNPITQGVAAFNNAVSSASTMFDMFNQSSNSPRRPDFNQMSGMQPNINNYYNAYEL